MSVKSKLDSTIIYKTGDIYGSFFTPEIAPNNKGVLSDLGIGNLVKKTDYVNYFPIYSFEKTDDEAVKPGSIIQLGVYEVNKTKTASVLDKHESGTVAPDIIEHDPSKVAEYQQFRKFGNVLWFPDKSTSITQSDLQEEKDMIEAIRQSTISGASELARTKPKKAPLGSNTSWIAKYFNDGNYRIVPIPGDGNCFFFTIARALRSTLSAVEQTTNTVPPIVLNALSGTDQEISSVAANLKSDDVDYPPDALNELNTVAALRIMLSKLVTVPMLRNVNDRFNDILGVYPAQVVQKSSQIEQQTKSVMDQIQKLDEEPPSKKRMNAHLKLVEELETLLDKSPDQVENDPTSANNRVSMAAKLGVAEELLPFDNGAITTLEQYKSYILSSAFWANDWAIGQLEYLLNIKTVIFEKNKWDRSVKSGKALSINNRADDNALLCGPVEIRQEIKRRGSFNPTEYILINWNGGIHFELITYDNNSLFTWAQLPQSTNDLILNHCKIHNSGGAFEYIPEIQAASQPTPSIDSPSIDSPSIDSPSIDSPELKQLTGMGFDRKSALKALAKTGTNNVEGALAVLLGEHSIGGKKTRRHKLYKSKTKKKDRKKEGKKEGKKDRKEVSKDRKKGSKNNLQMKERKTRGRKLKTRRTKKVLN